MDAKQNISSIRHFLKKRHWVSDVFAGMCLTAMARRRGSQAAVVGQVDVKMSGACTWLTWVKIDAGHIRISTLSEDYRLHSKEEAASPASKDVEDFVGKVFLGFILLG